MHPIVGRIMESPLEGPVRWAHRRFWPGRGGRYERELEALLRRWLRPDSPCVDVGAHRGWVLRLILKYAPRGRHYAFEPIPYLYERLARRFPAVEVHPLALCDRAGEATFRHVTADPGLSGLHETGLVAGRLASTALTVRTARLDDVVPADAPVRLVKIDVEGAEAAVLRGARRTLAAHRPIVLFEYGAAAADCYPDSTPAHIVELLAGHGLKVSLMANWLAGREPLTAAAFAAVCAAGTDYNFLAHP
jgi:FkbM family methyltransferase